jgi:hypothetical protein
MSDGEDYLQEGWEPRSVTVPRLRSILVTHNVDFPSTAKKPQLVMLVEDHVLSQAPKLRAQRDKAKRSSFGIVNAGSAEDKPGWDDHDLRPPPSVRRSKSPRKSSARPKPEDEELEPPMTSPRKRAVRSSSRQLSHADDNERDETELMGSVRRSRRTITPQIKAEPVDEEPFAHDEEDSVFTDDNPFQGKSSPPQVKTPSNRRRTTGGDSVRSTKSSRRRTDDYHFEDPNPTTTRSFGVPMPSRRLPSPEMLVEPEEEFTPEAQLELEEAARQGEITLRPQRVSSTPARRGSIKTPLLVLFLSLLGAYLAWYRQEKIAVGYCGLGRPANSMLPPDFPVPDQLLPIVEPQCEDCPSHAYCYADYSARCEPGFILRPHPLSLGGLVPPPSCEPDGEKARRVKAVADRAVDELRERRAKFECGELVDEEGQQVDSPAIAEEELKESVSKKRSKRLNDDEFNDLWAAAIGEVTKREEVVVETAVEAAAEAAAETPESATVTTERPIPRPFQTDAYRRPLSLAFHSAAPLGDKSGSDWQDIESLLDF